MMLYIEPVEVFLDIIGQHVEILVFFSSRPNNDLAPKINWETVTRYPIKTWHIFQFPAGCHTLTSSLLKRLIISQERVPESNHE